MKITPKVIKSLKERNKSAFEIVYREYYKLVYYVAFTITKDPELSQDIMQDTFVRLMNNIEEYKDDGKLKQYLTSIARNLSLNALKDKHRLNSTLDENIISSNSYQDNSKIGVLLILEKLLTPQEVDVVSLKILFDYSFKEISEELNLTIGTVQSTYYRSLEVMKQYFEKGNKL